MARIFGGLTFGNDRLTSQFNNTELGSRLDAMRILYHHRTMGEGAEGIHVRSIIEALRAAGHEVQVSALVGEPEVAPLAAPHLTRRWNGIRRFIPDALYELAEIAYNVVGRIKLERAIRKFRPDAIYDRYNTYSTAAVSAARFHHIPSILEVNAPLALERKDIEYLRLRLPRLARWFERRIFMAASHVLVVSSPLKRYLETELQVPSGHITVVPNGADPAAFAPDVSARRKVREKLGLADRFVMGFVGNARPWHGLELLVDALERMKDRVPNAHLLIVGGGSSLPAIKSLIEARGLNARVTISGEVPHPEVKAYIAAMDVAVSPRATFYASPLKVVEYMAMGKAVVAPDMENIRDLVRHDESALLFQPENVASLTQCLERLAADENLRERLGDAARAGVVTRRNWAANAAIIVGCIVALDAVF